MKATSLARRELIVRGLSCTAGLAFSSMAIAAVASDAGGSPHAGRQRARSDRPHGILVQVISLDPKHYESAKPKPLRVLPSEILSVQQRTGIALPYYFDIEVDRLNPSSKDWSYKVNLYDAQGETIGSATTSDNGSVVFTDQKIRFEFSGDYS